MRDDASSWFRRFHGGMRPVWTEHRFEAPRWVADLGPLVAVTYLRPTPHGEELREHTYAPHARPVLVRTDRGEITTVGGNYSVKEGGIVDNALGFRHAGQGFSPAGHGAMAHRFTPQGVPVHGMARPPEGVMVPRANPLGVEELKLGAERVVDALLVGGTTLAGMGVSDMIVERTTWTENVRAAAQGLGLGVPGGVLLLTGAHTIGTGLVTAGVASAGLRVARARQWDRIVAGWVAGLMPAPKTGGRIYDGGADVRVEAVANG